MKGSKTSIWLSRIRRKSHIPSLYRIPSISSICMVQILGLKREIRIPFSENGGIRLSDWNRTVIWNQCIRTGLDISSIPLLSPSLSFSPSYSIIITTTVWKKRRGLGLNVESCWPSHDCLPLMLGPPWKYSLGRGKKKTLPNNKNTESTLLHTPLTSILLVCLTCEKGLLKGCQEARKKEIGKDRRLCLLLCPACHTTMCMADN